jgi:poly-gamma-glutamate synthesis protein (capsule biosynthesis protein)
VLLAVTAISILSKSDTTYRNISGEPAKILFVGDLMFDRTIRTIANRKGYDFLFSCIGDYLRDFDIVIGNLEGPITNVASKSENTKPGDAGNTAFTFDVGIVKTLASNNLRMLNLGNNHILDFGTIGRDSTKKELSKANIGYFGAPGSPIAATTTLRGHKIAVINFNQFLGEDNSKKTIEAIWNAKRDSDFVAVYTHWGDEYLPATEYEKALAHSFIDAGSDIVIGSHPHIIQAVENYKGKNIYYSLGNFIFDQYWMDEVKTGGGVEIIIDSSSANERVVRFDIGRDGRTCLQSST